MVLKYNSVCFVKQSFLTAFYSRFCLFLRLLLGGGIDE